MQLGDVYIHWITGRITWQVEKKYKGPDNYRSSVNEHDGFFHIIGC